MTAPVTPMARAAAHDPVSTGDLQSISPIFPPSVGDEPAVYAWALFSLLTLTMLAVAVMLKTWGRLRAEALPLAHPLTHHRVVMMLLLGTIVSGAGPDALLLLLWGEIAGAAMTAIALADKGLDGLAIAPFIVAMLHPLARGWFPWSRRKPGGLLVLRDVMGDLKEPWPTRRTPVLLILTCGLISGLVAGVKWFAWQ